MTGGWVEYRVHKVTPRERRVSRNQVLSDSVDGNTTVTPRERRVSRNG